MIFERFYFLFILNLQTLVWILHCGASHSGLATFQGSTSHTWLPATVSDRAAIHTSPQSLSFPSGEMDDIRSDLTRVVMKKKQYDFTEPSKVAFITILLFFPKCRYFVIFFRFKKKMGVVNILTIQRKWRSPRISISRSDVLLFWLKKCLSGNCSTSWLHWRLQDCVH